MVPWLSSSKCFAVSEHTSVNKISVIPEATFVNKLEYSVCWNKAIYSYPKLIVSHKLFGQQNLFVSKHFT